MDDGLREGHVDAVLGADRDVAELPWTGRRAELVGAERIRELNREHRGIDRPTDVLSFPLDGAGPVAGPRELGDVAVCPEYCLDMTLTEASVHGVLHLCGYDHEVDGGEMLALQAEVLAGLR